MGSFNGSATPGVVACGVVEVNVEEADRSNKTKIKQDTDLNASHVSQNLQTGGLPMRGGTISRAPGCAEDISLQIITASGNSWFYASTKLTKRITEGHASRPDFKMSSAFRSTNLSI